MTKLQKLIEDKLAGGVSYREISRRTGVDLRSLRNYYKDGAEPRGKNLAALADYFNCHFADLFDDYVPAKELSPVKKEMLELLADATDDEVQALLLLLRKRHKDH